MPGSASSIDFRVSDAQPMIGLLASEVEEEYKKAGQPVPPPAVPPTEDSTIEQNYAPQTWTEAQRRWAALTPQQQQERTAQYESQVRVLMGAVKGSVRSQSFRESFSPYDGLWFILAALTAFRLGSGTASN